jgi:hypothetical protein
MFNYKGQTTVAQSSTGSLVSERFVQGAAL